MLDYIKQRIAEQQASVPSFDDHEDVENQMIVECAAIFQELDDLSVEGADAHRTRSLELDIPIENDIELDTIEFNLTDGRVVDIPMDAVVNQEHFAESMKSYAEFYMEACNVVQPYMREDEYHLEERRVAYAKKHFDVYQEQMIQEGLFGFDKIKLDDPRVPTNVMVDFGPMKEGASQHYVVKLPVFFEVDKKHCVVQAQLDAVTQLQNHNPFEKIAEPLIDALKNKHGIDLGKKTLWDIATPQKLLVPVPKDSYVVMVAFDVEGVSELVYMGWYLARKKSERSYDKHMLYPPEKCESLAKRLDFSNKKEFVKESYVESTPVERPLPSRWDNSEFYMYQEAIDFGYPDESTEAANKNQPADVAPPDPNADNMNQPTVSVDQNATPDVNTTDAPPTENTPGEPVDASATDDKVPVETNDVSDQIAQKISDETTNNDQGNLDADMNLDDINTDMGDPSSTTPDVGDMSSTDSIDNSLNDLDMSSTDSTDVPMGDPSTMDINSMSIDDIMTQAAEKLKSMPIEQVKQFLADGAGGMDTSSTDMGMDDTSMTESYYQQEAFFITKKNVKNELDVALRACLGTLNDSEKSLTQIIADFKKNGKKLNRVLGKALKMKEVFNENQMEHLNKLNTALLKLQTGLKPTNSTEETAAVKGLIKAFTDEAVIVGKMLETPTTSETTSEKESE